MTQPVAADARPGRVIAVLGMHRSGTSALAGSLQEHGLFLGDVSTRDRHNPKGNRESVELRRLNENVLRQNGGGWAQPPADVTWSEQQLDRARAMISEHAGRPVWGFKDPRTLLTLAGWRALVPDLERVGIFRHPARVARSLERRNGMSQDEGIALWLAYNEALLAELRREPFPLVSFDDEPETFREKLVEVARRLGLGESTREDRFFAAELRDAEPVERVGPPAKALYEELQALTL
jgi:hypothetical protein